MLLSTKAPRPARTDGPALRHAARWRGRLPERSWLLRAGRYVVVPVLLALAVTWGLEYVHALNDVYLEPLDRLGYLPQRVVEWGAFVVGSLIFLLLAVVGRLWLTAVIALGVAGIVGFADYHKMQLRGEPVYPSDLEYLLQPRLLLESIGIEAGTAILGVVVTLATITGLAVLGRRLVRRRGPRPAPLLTRRRRWALRGVVGVLAAAVLWVAAGFNEPGNILRAEFDRSGTNWARWDQPDNYAKNGFIAGTLYNLPGTAMPRPAGYGAEAMDDLVEKYGALAAEMNATRDPAALEDTNVVVILGETFADPMLLNGVDIAEDPIPYTRQLMTTTTSGSMLSNGFGGGTANVEFEVVTGMAVQNFHAQMHTPYQMVVPHQETFPSFVRSLGENRDTLAIHPYSRSFYRRDAVYPTLGFDRATFREEMRHSSRIENDKFISDRSTFRELVSELEDADDPMFVNVVTMQNHRPLPGKYSDPMDVDGPMTWLQKREVGQYLRGLKHSDEAIEQLVTDLQQLDERTIVLFYGDHLSAAWPQTIRDMNHGGILYRTPWFVWANFPTEQIDVPPMVSPNFLVNQMLESANAPVTPFNALLEELEKEIPAYEPTMLMGPDGETLDPERLSPRAQELVEDYKMIQYDLSIGQRYSEDAMYEEPAAR